jgi:hypothetical protein
MVDLFAAVRDSEFEDTPMTIANRYMCSPTTPIVDAAMARGGRLSER